MLLHYPGNSKFQICQKLPKTTSKIAFFVRKTEAFHVIMAIMNIYLHVTIAVLVSNNLPVHTLKCLFLIDVL